MGKSVRVPFFLILIIAVFIIALFWYLYDRSAKFAESVVASEKTKLENERLSLMARFSSLLQIEEPPVREPVGFKLSS
ncbi:MAG: hypothetical protein HOP10_02245 [Chitinophagaceae bacterium]|nr:hypothetical protein [Chitinophagaceae bacterium]